MYRKTPKHNSLKLIYFPVRARAEHIRWSLKAAGVPFEDVHIEMSEWPSRKGEMPLGQLPVLEVDGVKIAQTMAIARFIGEEYGLMAKRSVDRARLDMIAECVREAGEDIIPQWAMVQLGFRQVPDKNAFYREEIKPKLEKHAPIVEKFLTERDAPFFNGEEVTWVDIFAAEFFSKFQDFGEKEALDAFPRLRALVDRVREGIPAIREHIAQRKQTPF